MCIIKVNKKDRDNFLEGSVSQTQDIRRWHLDQEGEKGVEIKELLDTISDSIYIVDSEGYLVYGNPAWLQTVEMEAELVLGRHIKDVLWDHSFSAHFIKQNLDTAARRREEEEYGQQLYQQVLDQGHTVTIHVEGEGRYITGYPIRLSGEGLTYVLILEQNFSEELRLPLQVVHDSETGESMIGTSPAMEKVRRLIKEVANTDVTVMIMGETGVGKEVAAGEIQRLSARSHAPFVRINCAAIPGTLLESELFGYETGAFTGAAKGGRAGLLERANHGTILLDEIGELPLSMQPKLLRAIQERVIFRVGGGDPIPIDIRVLAATNRNLYEMVTKKQFREDLYYRLNVIPLHIPPLRERGNDIILLAEDFLRKCNERNGRKKYFTERARRLLLHYNWPGNIRELRNLVDRLVVLGQSSKISEEVVRACLYPEEEDGVSSGPDVGRVSLQEATDQFQKKLIQDALARYGSTYKAAAALGTSQSTLSRKARQLGVDVGERRETVLEN